MRNANLFFAYAPRGSGLRCAVVYLADHADVYGWFTGPRQDTSVASQYFLLEGLYTAAAARYEAVAPEALHSRWLLDEPRRHQLARLQDSFAREWLFYRDDARAMKELEAYAEAELACGEVGVRFGKLAKFDTQQPNWTFYSPGFERTVLRHLAKRWPLEYRPHGDEIPAAQKARRAGDQRR